MKLDHYVGKIFKNEDLAIGLDGFGKGPYKKIYDAMGLTSNKIVSIIQKIKKIDTLKLYVSN